MSSIVLAGRSYRHGVKSLSSHLSPSLSQTSRAASLNSAIGRGLRRSKGVGFRGKEISQERSGDGFGDNSRSRDGPVRRTADPPPSILPGRLNRDAWRKAKAALRISGSTNPTMKLRRGKKDIKEDLERPKRLTRAARFNDPNYSFGKRATERREKMAEAPVQYRGGFQSLRITRPDVDGEITEGRDRPQITSAARRAAESDRTALERNPNGSKLSNGRLAYLARVAESSQREHLQRPGGGPVIRSVGEHQPRFRGGRDWSPTNTEDRPNRENKSDTEKGDMRSTFAQTVNDRLPLSIPYTTPASEFLYGTSVVEAALRSRREPRRKLYKMFVYKSVNREFGAGNVAIEHLAKKIGVDVIYHTESPRLLDKMSGGRPHNGYILEASPLPRLPITSLGSLNVDGKNGFMVNLDHQSREEASINGTSPFISLPSKRKPLILFLDSILDPGNLGGIIRTASFLGVTAIALSIRNSAPLSPVVLKASAGASESITLFSVNKPAGFISDSKSAGWKVYAAVAPRVDDGASSRGLSSRSSGPLVHPSPSRESSSDTPQIPFISSDDLLFQNPLQNDPCIIMLGNEGEGLRWNLRSKADVEIAIRGSAHRGGVDSLNVSVAAGIICQAFLTGKRSRSKGSQGLRMREEGKSEVEGEMKSEVSGEDLFKPLFGQR